MSNKLGASLIWTFSPLFQAAPNRAAKMSPASSPISGITIDALSSPEEILFMLSARFVSH